MYLSLTTNIRLNMARRYTGHVMKIKKKFYLNNFDLWCPTFVFVLGTPSFFPKLISSYFNFPYWTLNDENDTVRSVPDCVTIVTRY